MEFKGQQHIRASRETVWSALNDPSILAQCIDGCESFVAVSNDEWKVVVRASVGPVKARFKGSLTILDRQELNGYQLKGQGDGGIAGFGEMVVTVTLEDSGADTLLHYQAHASVSGKLAQIGSRLVGAVGAKMIDHFFARFNDVLTNRVDTITSSLQNIATETPLASNQDSENGTQIELLINGEPIRRTIDNRTLLVDLLRRELRLTGTHVGCDTSQCGACTVRLNGVAVKSCTVLAVQASGEEVVTIEGLANGQEWHPLQKAFMQCHGLQCGFCTPGMIMASESLLRSGQEIDPASICRALEGNICRCTGYYNISKAVMQAAAEVGATKNNHSTAEVMP